MRTLAALALLFCLVLPTQGHAVEPREQLANPALEARAREISKGLRCLVCRNESIDESGADLAHDVRVLLRERLSAGDTDTAAVQYIVDRYGDFVLLNPPVKRATYVLWFGPPVLLLAAGLVVFLTMRHRKRELETPPTPLSPDEQARLDALLRESPPS
jgi:cytochrome c-type biogenesis protein CcmH